MKEMDAMRRKEAAHKYATDVVAAWWFGGPRPVPRVYRTMNRAELYEFLRDAYLKGHDDGWQVGTLEEAGISFGPIRDMVQNEIDPPATSVDDLYVHGLLISRHGKLVFEDYFHGYHRNLPHDTRSASKSLTAVLTGAVTTPSRERFSCRLRC